MIRFIATIMVTLSAFALQGQIEKNYQNIYFENEVYTDYIKSVEFGHQNIELSLPIIDLNSGGVLRLEFDDIEGGFKQYIYTLVHCDRNWNPTPFRDEIEFLDGFNNEEIDNFSYSSNGYSEYTHYSLSIPNDDVRWTVSGNYLLIITDDDMEVPVLTRRFIVTEDIVNTSLKFMRPQNNMKRRSHHEMEVAINYQDLRVSRPSQELSITMLQNGNWETAKYNLTGNYERGRTLIYDQYDKYNFPALREFRNFDIRTTDSRTQYVRKIHRGIDATYVTLDTTLMRLNRNNRTENDANGYFIIDNDRYPDPDVSSEYAYVSFALACDQYVTGDIYVLGAFSDWKPREEYKLTYNAATELWTTTAQFKQGYYDYTFANVVDGVLNLENIERNWHETENEYQVIVYYSEFGSDYDRVIDVMNMSLN